MTTSNWAAGVRYRRLGSAAAVALLVGLAMLAFTALLWSDSVGWLEAVSLFVAPYGAALAALAWLSGRSYGAPQQPSQRVGFALASGLTALAICAALLGATWLLAALIDA